VRALLGAAALGDIGRHFPDSDPKYKTSTAAIPARSRRKIAKQDSRSPIWTPRSSPRRRKMALHIRRWSRTSPPISKSAPTRSTSKAKTAERLGAIGRGEGIAAERIALIE